MLLYLNTTLVHENWTYTILTAHILYAVILQDLTKHKQNFSGCGFTVLVLLELQVVLFVNK